MMFSMWKTVTTHPTHDGSLVFRPHLGNRMEISQMLEGEDRNVEESKRGAQPPYRGIIRNVHRAIRSRCDKTSGEVGAE